MNIAETLPGLRRRVQRDELDRLLAKYPLLRVDLSAPSGGWIRTIRTGLGMTAKQLGRRLGVTQASVSEAEKAEIEGGITLKTMRRVADGLNCDLVYALIPRTDLNGMVYNQANRAAHQLASEVQHGMALEKQSTDPASRDAEVGRLRDRLIAQGASLIWD